SYQRQQRSGWRLRVRDPNNAGTPPHSSGAAALPLARCDAADHQPRRDALPRRAPRLEEGPGPRGAAGRAPTGSGDVRPSRASFHRAARAGGCASGGSRSPCQKHRPFSSEEGPPGIPAGGPAVSVVGIPDPITWVRCRVLMYLVDLHFGFDIEEFEKGVKQALVHVSGLLSSGKYHNLVGIVSSETIDYVQMRCGSLSEARRRQLAVTMDDIVFALPEDVSVVFDKHGRQFCDVAMRFWLLSTYEGPDDPEGTKIFQVAPSGDGGPQRRIVTAVYE
uniref:Si:dkey-82o10.4 n=1 Tax=Gasterosteus aculeatus aculeatus TaxID=481459 RepID=A0AAQ4S3S1_GASAC